MRIVRTGATKVVQVAGKLGIWGTKQFRSRILPEWDFADLASGSLTSGSFGEDLAGEWLDGDEISRLWQYDSKEYRRMGQDFWCDLHACVSK